MVSAVSLCQNEPHELQLVSSSLLRLVVDPYPRHTWCCPATGRKPLSAASLMLPGGTEKQLRDTLQFMVTLLNRLFEVKTDDILFIMQSWAL